MNGVSTGFFPTSCGMQQGDLLSLYLFIIGMVVLSILLRKAEAGSFIIDYFLSDREGVAFSISHLLFADDIIVFYKAIEDQLLHLSWVLF